MTYVSEVGLHSARSVVTQRRPAETVRTIAQRIAFEIERPLASHTFHLHAPPTHGMSRSSRKRFRRPPQAVGGDATTALPPQRCDDSVRDQTASDEMARDELSPKKTIEENSALTEVAPQAVRSAGVKTDKGSATPHRPDAVLDRLDLLLSKFDSFDTRIELLVNLTESSFDDSDEDADRAEDAQSRDRLQDDLHQLRGELDEAWRENDELRRQNEELQQARTAQVASSGQGHGHGPSPGRSGAAAPPETSPPMSWEERKEMILRQMEEDSFDADQFVNSLSEQARIHAEKTAREESPDEDGRIDRQNVFDAVTPQQFIEAITTELDQARATLAAREEELGELRILLQDQSDSRQTGLAFGANAIQSLIDADPLIIEERERLEELKNHWEDKFRQAEIEASLERAKLSRERQQLAKRSEELEEKLVEVQRQLRDQAGTPRTGRRWLAELGLSPDSDS